MAVFLATVNVVLPIGLIILVGVLLRRFRFLDDKGTAALNAVSFRALLPCLVFCNVYGKMGETVRYTKLILFCVLGYIAAYIVLALLVARLERDADKKGSILQGCIHNSFLIIGVSLLENLYPGMEYPALGFAASFMILLNNVGSGVALQMFRGGKHSLRGILLNVVRNPVIIACALAVMLDLIDLKVPEVVLTTAENLSGATVPICLIALGSSLRSGSMRQNLTRAFGCSVVKLMVLPLIMVPIAISMGFRGEELIVVLMMAGSPTAPVTYSLAAEMGGDKDLASNIILLANCLAIGTIFCFIYFMLNAGLL